jgi:phospholipid/cholesterol/gamma-HCH transport system substrate-binding protein
MIKQAPKAWQLAVMTLFVLSCFGVLLYLWLSFGGTSPLAAKGYRFHVYFPEATQLAQQADVRISGVPVGKVVKIERGTQNGTDATLELRSRYAPVPRDARAMLRTKTLLGETYVDLSPGNPKRGLLDEDAALPRSAVADTVELDEIFRSFDKPTREAFQTWMQSSSAAIAGRGADLNALLGNLPALEAGAEDLLRELNAQSGAVTKTISSTATVFDALSERQGQLRTLVTESNKLFGVTAARNQDLANIFRELPRFERESRLTLPRLTAFSNAALPAVKQLQPAATEAAPAFEALNQLGPQFRSFFTALGPVIDASRAGVPALERTLGQLPPLLDDFQPFLRNVDPIVRYLGLNKREVTALLGNFVGATSGRDTTRSSPVHYLRALAPLGPQSLSFYPRPLGSSRSNAYAVPGAADRLATGLPVYDSRSCTNGDPAPPTSSDPPELVELAQTQAFRTALGDRNVLRPACTQQEPYPGFGTSFPQLRAEP